MSTKRMLLVLAALVMLGGSMWRLRAKDQPSAGTTTRKVPPITGGGDVWAELQRRPLVLPSIAPGEPCPVTTTSEVLPGQRLPGDGPIYSHFVTDARPISYGDSNEEGGWHYIKTLWRASGQYIGPALIRGRQLDGEQELRFGDGPNPAAELRFPVETGVRSQYTVNGWRDNPSYTRIKAPGCYAWQINGLDFRTVIVFKAEP